jgi:hypothetical protein
MVCSQDDSTTVPSDVIVGEIAESDRPGIGRDRLANPKSRTLTRPSGEATLWFEVAARRRAVGVFEGSGWRDRHGLSMGIGPARSAVSVDPPLHDPLRTGSSTHVDRGDVHG